MYVGSEPSTPPEAGIGSAPLAGYLAELASGNPMPGGGSAVGVAGAMGAALAEMVCNLTVGRRAYADAEDALRQARGRAGELRTRFLALAADDAVAYGQYIAATKLPKGNDAARAVRQAALQDALVVAADVPLAVAEACLDLLDVLAPIAAQGNRHAVSDATVGALLAEAALRGALLNVRTNAQMMTDPTRAGGYLARSDEAEATARARAANVISLTSAPRDSPSAV